jgi:hypothetical protein
MSTPPLTPAEQAAAEAIVAYWTPLDGEPDIDVDDVADEARAVVAAVRPITDAEALADAARVLRRVLEDDDYAEQVDIYLDEKAAYGVVAAAKQLDVWAQRLRQSLSRPTEENR